MLKFEVGQPLRRFEDRRLLAGRGRFQDDVSPPCPENPDHISHTYERGDRQPTAAAFARAARIHEARGQELAGPGFVDDLLALPAVMPLGVAELDMPATSARVWQAIKRARPAG
jgi:hypothetical protein